MAVKVFVVVISASVVTKRAGEEIAELREKYDMYMNDDVLFG